MEGFACSVCCEVWPSSFVGVCNHRDVCLRCGLRLRLLLNDSKCPICKTSLPQIVVSKDKDRPFEELLRGQLVEGPSGVWFEDREERDMAERMAGVQCWLEGCQNVRTGSRNGLKKHLEVTHKLRFCEICLKNRVVFLCEQRLFTPRDLDKHIMTGDDFGPCHPQCLFCKNRYFDEQSLRNHLQEEHFACGICEESCKSLFYADYERLQRHFIKAHYFCQELVCLQHQFVVFRTYVEFHHHRIACHTDTSTLTKAQRDQLMQLPLVADKEVEPNTEAVDFSDVFAGSSGKKQSKGKGGTLRNRLKRELGEVKTEEIMQIFKKYTAGNLPAETCLERWIWLFGPEYTSTLLPVLISSVKSEERRSRLQSIYQNLSNTPGPKPSNRLANAKGLHNRLLALQEILYTEVQIRAKLTERPLFYLHPSLLLQMASLIDGLEQFQMLKFAFILNFRVSQQAKDLLIAMVTRADDFSFASQLEGPYEQHFLGKIEPLEVYISWKYVDICVCKVKGLPFKSLDTPVLRNMEEERKAEEGTGAMEDAKEDKNWVEEKKRRLVQGNEQFPSLVPSSQPQLPASWGPPTAPPPSTPSEEPSTLPYGLPTVTVTRGKGRHKKAVTIIRL